MTLTCGIVGFLVLVMYTIISNINAGINVNIASYIIIVAIYLSIIIPISTKTASLTTTPTVMLVLTIIQLLFTLLLFSGIIPLIAVVYNIIALARWSTYRNWYDEVSVGFYKGEESIQKKEKSQKVVKPKDVYDFSVDEECDVDNGQKKPIGLIVSLVFAIILGIGGCIGCFYWGRNGGWIDGYATGNKRAAEELNRLKTILSKTEETRYLNGEWWFYTDSGGYHRRSDTNYDSLDACKEAFASYTTGELTGATGGCAKNCILNIGANYALSLSKCEEYEPL